LSPGRKALLDGDMDIPPIEIKPHSERTKEDYHITIKKKGEITKSWADFREN